MSFRGCGEVGSLIKPRSFHVTARTFVAAVKIIRYQK